MKAMKKVIILVLLSIFMCIYVTAQVQVNVVDENTTEDQNNNDLHGVMSIKLNPLLFIRGDIPLYFELSLTSQVAVEVGAGLTIIDYFSTQSLFLDGAFNEDISPKIGYSGRIGLRYYAANYGYQPEGLYFALDYRFQRYNYTLNSLGSMSDLNEDISNINNDGKLTVGYVKYWGDNFFFEPYAGFGIRTSTIDFATPNATFNSYTIEQNKYLLPLLSLGFKIGIWII
ncbi:MAG: hypothetical protein C0596_16235 [Marinilabiliales bacterium]|nr:MAG: hypothetical protein C0596_16235 [Marinilabiliales bacterium]